jgi:hypothetical protein
VAAGSGGLRAIKRLTEEETAGFASDITRKGTQRAAGGLTRLDDGS